VPNSAQVAGSGTAFGAPPWVAAAASDAGASSETSAAARGLSAMTTALPAPITKVSCTIESAMGHSQIGVTMDIYSHVLPSMQQEAASKLNEMLGGSAG
jgi:hypothetical protein